MFMQFLGTQLFQMQAAVGENNYVRFPSLLQKIPMLVGTAGSQECRKRDRQVVSLILVQVQTLSQSPEAGIVDAASSFSVPRRTHSGANGLNTV